MAKIKVKGIKELSEKINRDLNIEVNKLFRDKDLRDAIGTIIAEDIKTNQNFGVPAPSTLDWRTRYDPVNATDPKYARHKLNATFTGELLDDLASNVKGITTEKAFIIEHSDGRHKKYQGIKKKIGSRSKYKDISEGLVNDLGYDYFNISKEAQTEVTQLVKDKIFQLLSK